MYLLTHIARAYCIILLRQRIGSSFLIALGGIGGEGEGQLSCPYALRAGSLAPSTTGLCCSWYRAELVLSLLQPQGPTLSPTTGDKGREGKIFHSFMPPWQIRRCRDSSPGLMHLGPSHLQPHHSVSASVLSRQEPEAAVSGTAGEHQGKLFPCDLRASSLTCW